MAVLFEGASDCTDWVGAGAMGAVVRAGMSNESLSLKDLGYVWKCQCGCKKVEV